MALIAESFPEESWTHVYTDGTASNAVTGDESMPFPDQPNEAVCIATGKFCANYKAEVEALSKAAEVCLCLSQSDCRPTGRVFHERPVGPGSPVW